MGALPPRRTTSRKPSPESGRRPTVNRACHTPTVTQPMPQSHIVLPMTQDIDLEDVVRSRIRGLRTARGWYLDDLARHCHLSPSNLSRIETGHRRIALDQLLPIARALGTTLDQLLESVDDDNIVIRPQRDVVARDDHLAVNPHERGPHGVTVAKIRVGKPTARTENKVLRVHPEESGSPYFRGRSVCNWAIGPSS